MKKEFGKYVAIVLGIICVILAIALICIRVSSVNAQSSDKDLREKISEEISYLDSSISQLMNKMNNIDIIKYKVYTKQIDVPKEDESSSSGNSQESSGSSSENSSEGSSSQSGGENSSSGQTSGGQSQGQASSEGQGNTTNVSELVPSVTLEGNNEEIDWNQISFLVEKIYSIWPSVNLDLQKQGISTELINSFSLSMDGLIQSIKNKDKGNTLINLFNMYINIPKYSSSISEDNDTINKYNTKLNILNAYVLVSNDDNWNSAIASVTAAKNCFASIVSNTKENEDKKSAMQKAYVILEDLERITQINDKQIFFMGYKNVMQELETI